MLMVFDLARRLLAARKSTGLERTVGIEPLTEIRTHPKKILWKLKIVTFRHENLKWD